MSKTNIGNGSDGSHLLPSGDSCRRLAAAARINRALVRAFGDVAVVWNRNPIVVARHCVVVPDFAVLRCRDHGYAFRLPVADDVLLTVDIEGMGMELARIWKARLYAGSGIPECWLIDVAGRRLEAHCSPDQKTYRLKRDVGRSDSIAPRSLPDCRIRVADLLLPI